MRLLNTISAMMKGQTSHNRIAPMPAMFEPLEGRELLSASSHVKASHPKEPPHAVHGKASSSSPLYNFVGKATADGSSTAKTIVLQFMTDENGQISAKLAGDGAGLNDVLLTGTHSGNDFSLSYTGPKGSVSITASLADDGKSVTGTFTFTREGSTVSGVFTAKKLAAKKSESDPKPAPKPDPKPAPKPAPKNGAVRYSVVSRFRGDFKPDGSDRTFSLSITVAKTSDGHDILIVESPVFGKNPTFVMWVTGDGSTFSGSGKGEHGTTTMSATFSSDGQTLSGMVNRSNDGKVVSGSFSLTKMA